MSAPLPVVECFVNQQTREVEKFFTWSSAWGEMPWHEAVAIPWALLEDEQFAEAALRRYYLGADAAEPMDEAEFEQRLALGVDRALGTLRAIAAELRARVGVPDAGFGKPSEGERR